MDLATVAELFLKTFYVSAAGLYAHLMRKLLSCFQGVSRPLSVGYETQRQKEGLIFLCFLRNLSYRLKDQSSFRLFGLIDLYSHSVGGNIPLEVKS